MSIQSDQILHDGSHAGYRRRRTSHDLIERGVDGSPRRLERLVVVGAVLDLEKPRPCGFVGLQEREYGIWRFGRRHRRHGRQGAARVGWGSRRSSDRLLLAAEIQVDDVLLDAAQRQQEDGVSPQSDCQLLAEDPLKRCQLVPELIAVGDRRGEQ
jgi:hypothetical protein